MPLRQELTCTGFGEPVFNHVIRLQTGEIEAIDQKTSTKFDRPPEANLIENSYKIISNGEIFIRLFFDRELAHNHHK